MGYFEKGKDYYEQGKYSQALEYFLAAMEEDKLNAEVCFWSALAYKSMNNDFGYRKNVFRALSIDPDNNIAQCEAKIILGGVVSGQNDSNKRKSVQKVFSVSPSKKVQFAPGNVQYHTVGQYWVFADRQFFILGVHEHWDRMGTKYLDSPINLKYDLFYWGTSDDITMSHQKGYYFSEWGDHFSGTWRTLSYDEWDYLFTERKNAENLYRFSTVAGIEGVVILPDECTGCEIKDFYDDFPSWDKMEELGAAFLPIAGYYSKKAHQYYEGDWVYQTCSHNKFYYRLDKRKQKNIPHLDLDKSFQLPVRLVKDIKD